MKGEKKVVADGGVIAVVMSKFRRAARFLS